MVPSRYEPFGLVALESQTVGTPVVAAATGGLIEVVNVEFGRLVPPTAEGLPADEIAIAIAEVVDAPVRRPELTDWAIRSFPEQPHVERLLELYRG